MINYIQGDIRDTEHPIAHGVNCQNAMGSGVAKALFERWPQVKEEYHKQFWATDEEHYDLKLGSYHRVDCGDKIVYNMFTQFTYGYDGKKRVNYAAIAKCFTDLARTGIKDIAIPKIGCGLAGGDWDIVEQIILDVIEMDPINVHVYYLE